MIAFNVVGFDGCWVVSCAFSDTRALQLLSVPVRVLFEWAGDDGLGLLLLALCAVILALASQWTFSRLIGFLRSSIGRRARNIFYAGALNFLGFNFRTCTASVLFATALYLLLKLAFRFPQILPVWTGTIGTTILAFSVAGYWIGGRLAPLNFIKYFYIPAAAGIVFFLLNVLLDFVLSMTGTLIALATSA